MSSINTKIIIYSILVGILSISTLASIGSMFINIILGMFILINSYVALMVFIILLTFACLDKSIYKTITIYHEYKIAAITGYIHWFYRTTLSQVRRRVKKLIDRKILVGYKLVSDRVEPIDSNSLFDELFPDITKKSNIKCPSCGEKMISKDYFYECPYCGCTEKKD